MGAEEVSPFKVSEWIGQWLNPHRARQNSPPVQPGGAKDPTLRDCCNAVAVLASAEPRRMLFGMDQAILEQQALRLPARARALLAEALLESLDDDAVREIEAAWGQEAEARLQAFHRGELDSLDGSGVLREVRRKYQK
jgi:hypothetical protein